MKSIRARSNILKWRCSFPPWTRRDLPPLAKALVEGNRVSLADMTAVLDEHDRTDQSIARILTAQGSVSEADLMWGMAQEMGLEFVDLDLVGVELCRSGNHPRGEAGTTT